MCSPKFLLDVVHPVFRVRKNLVELNLEIANPRDKVLHDHMVQQFIFGTLDVDLHQRNAVDAMFHQKIAGFFYPNAHCARIRFVD